MGKREQFIEAVKGYAVAMAVLEQRHIAGAVIAQAMRLVGVPEDDNPEEYARQFVGYQFGRQDKPEWLA